MTIGNYVLTDFPKLKPMSSSYEMKNTAFYLQEVSEDVVDRLKKKLTFFDYLRTDNVNYPQADYGKLQCKTVPSLLK